MGFLDNILKKVGATLATRYGAISAGKFEGCKIALGNPPKAKVETANSFSQLIVLNENEEVARFEIVKAIEFIEYKETIQFPATGNDGYRCEIMFRDGDSWDVDLYPSKLRVFYNNTRVVMETETGDFFKKEIEKLPQA